MKNKPILSKNISNSLSKMESRLKRAIVITFDEPRESYLKKTLRNGRRTSWWMIISKIVLGDVHKLRLTSKGRGSRVTQISTIHKIIEEKGAFFSQPLGLFLTPDHILQNSAWLLKQKFRFRVPKHFHFYISWFFIE